MKSSRLYKIIVLSFFFLITLFYLRPQKIQALSENKKIIYSTKNGQFQLGLKAIRDGWDKRRKHYWAEYRIYPIKGPINKFRLIVGKFYCSITPQDSICGKSYPGSHHIGAPIFTLNQLKKNSDNSYSLYIDIEPINKNQCGSFQSDIRISHINGLKVEKAILKGNQVKAEKFAWTNCSLAVKNGKTPFNCGLPIDWRPNCTTQPTPTPTNTPTPTPTPTTPPASIPTPTPQNNQTINQNVNVNQNVTIQNSANNVLGTSTQKQTYLPKQMPKTGTPLSLIVSSATTALLGIYLKRKGL